MNGSFEQYETRPVVVEAKQARIVTPVMLPDGRIILAEPGDWLIRPREGVHAQIVRAPIFARMFEFVAHDDTIPGQYDLYQTRVHGVLAFRLFHDEDVNVRGLGLTRLPAGCWIVKTEDGRVLPPQPDDLFRENYTPVTAGAQRQWLEQTRTVWPVWPWDSHPDRPEPQS